eukprot:Amastigsp_a177065_21.p1 type:complete len:320 gc:universal Amastigsp_a177065_21:145-1104(+)
MKLKDVVLAVGIFGSYTLYALAQERLYATRHGAEGERFSFSLALVFVQCVANALMGLIFYVGTGAPANTAPISKFAIMGALYISAMYASNSALNFVDMVTQVIGKTCKPIPVLLVGSLVWGKRYTTERMVCVLVLCVGICLFFLTGAAKPHAKGSGVETTTLGIVFLAISLFFDGFSGSFQDSVTHTYKPDAYLMMLYTNAFAVLYIAIALVLTGEGSAALAFVNRHPSSLVDISIFSATSALGQLFIFSTLTHLGALVLSMITTSRKFFTVLLSILWFGHELTTGQWTGVALVFGALGLDIYSNASKAGAGAAHAKHS